MIKIFEDFNEIHAMCKKYSIKNYTINPDGSIDVAGSVHLYDWNFTELPLKFGRVSSDFDCSYNKLTTLEGCPNYVGSSFYCGKNELSILDGCPSHVGAYFDCHDNNIRSLKGAPKEIGGYFIANNNPLPNQILDNTSYINYILANQDDYGIWNRDGSFNKIRFDMMMKDKDL